MDIYKGSLIHVSLSTADGLALQCQAISCFLTYMKDWFKFGNLAAVEDKIKENVIFWGKIQHPYVECRPIGQGHDALFRVSSIRNIVLTHWTLYKMVDILQLISQNAFKKKKRNSLYFDLNFTEVCSHWYHGWHGVKQDITWTNVDQIYVAIWVTRTHT